MDAHDSLPAEMSPSHYLEKVSVATGKVLDEEIRPEELLVRAHRDFHLADIQARRFMSLLMKQTGDAGLVLRKMRELRRLGRRTSKTVARMLGGRDPSRVAEVLFGLKQRHAYFRFKKPAYSGAEIADRVARLRREAAGQLAARRNGERPGLRVLVTGGTGFVGQELLWQAAQDDDVAELVVLIRPKETHDRRSGQRRVLSSTERGERLLEQLGLDAAAGAKLRFITGDVEAPGLGVAESDRERLGHTLTHVVHSAASVAFDDPYPDSFRANVIGTRHALRFSHALQTAPASPFVAHVGIETAYIHGRKLRQIAGEDEVVFPLDFYNNYYELTKAMATFETERFMLEEGLRLVQLCPAIVIGDSRSGNNRGDSKVINAPVNLLGRVQRVLAHPEGGWLERSKTTLLGHLAAIFPADRSAQLNMITVDRVAAGILAAMKRPQAVGERIHLANDNRVTAAEMRQILHEEIGIGLFLAEPTVHRNFTGPALGKLLAGLKQERLASNLARLSTIFGNYSEWGQPVHAVGKDVAVLGLPAERPNARNAFRMLCRHNRHVLEFGQVRDPSEIARRERLWRQLVLEIEERSGAPAGVIPAADFRQAVESRLELPAFERRRP